MWSKQRWICNARNEDRIPAGEVKKNGINLIAWWNVYIIEDYNGFVIQKKIKESAWSSKYRTFQKLIADCPDNNIVQ